MSIMARRRMKKAKALKIKENAGPAKPKDLAPQGKKPDQPKKKRQVEMIPATLLDRED